MEFSTQASFSFKLKIDYKFFLNSILKNLRKNFSMRRETHFACETNNNLYGSFKMILGNHILMTTAFSEYEISDNTV